MDPTDISDLPVPPTSPAANPDLDVSDLPPPPTSKALPASTVAAFAKAAKLTREPTPQEAEIWAAHPELIPGNEPQIPVSDQINALGTGINAGVVDLVGMLGDTAHSATELIKAGLGTGYHALTGNDIPNALQPRDAAADPGTSEWLKNQVRHVGLGNQIDAQASDDFSQGLHTTGEIIGPAPLAAAGSAIESAVTKAADRGSFRVPETPEAPAAPVAEPPAGQDPVESILSQPKAGSPQGIAPEAKAAPEPPPAVVHTTDERQHTVTSQNGSTTAFVRPHGLQITDTQTAKAAQGTGEGTARIAKMADAAQELGLPLISDTKVSPEAAKVYAKLKAAGYDVTENTHSVDEDGDLKSDTTRPVFEVRAPSASHGEFVPPKKAESAVEFARPDQEGTVKAAAPEDAQAQRAEALRAVGIKESRRSAVTGDYNETGTDFQTSRLDNEPGKRMKGVMDSERQALRDHTDRLLADTGGTAGLDQGERDARGQVLTSPVNSYLEHLDAVAQRHYKLADQRAAGQPIQMAGVNQFLSKNRAAFFGTTEGKQLLEGVQTRLEELGLKKGGANDGTFQPATVEQAERMRQYLNDNWSPRTSRLIGQLKSQLDEDVARAAGADIYRESRQVRAMRGTVEESSVIQKLIDPDDKLGINRSTPHEAVPAMLTKQPAQQFRQYVNVLKDAAGASPELKERSAAALRELRAQFVNEIRAAGDSTQGMWNQKAVNQYLRDRSANMHAVFTLPEMQQFKHLNDAGNYLRMDRSYPGAAAQGHNFAVSGAIKLAEHGATGAGALLGHVPGAIVGHAVGKGVEKVDSALMRKMVEKRIMSLEDAPRHAARGVGGRGER